MIRQKDIARECGVSIATVSMAINKPYKISRDVRDKIYTLIDASGYKKNKSDVTTIGVAFDNFQNYFLGDFYNEVLLGIFSRSGELNVNIRVLNNFGAISPKNIYGLDGILFVGKTSDEYIEKALEYKVCLVNAGHPNIHYPQITSVYCEREQTTPSLVNLLLNCGHKNIAVLLGEPEEEVICKEFLKAIAATNPYHNDKFVFQASVHDIDTVEVAWHKILSCKPKISALMCYSDLMAYYIYRCAQKHNVHIPKDLSITGYDGIQAPRYLKLPHPKLTTIQTDRILLGMKSMDLLWHNITSEIKHRKNITINGSVVVNDSVARIN
ncbi:MAG: LacI family DNA-binding transcriptional regulator [Candidatus Margulisbacteria bacterium]|nr:LacI family DNA-binding transcriptional regulator [Candidatus Margulisiibacteriota bacterium]